MATSGESAGRGRLHGKRIIITGAGNGIGRAAATRYAAAGATILVVDRAKSAAEETVESIVRTGGTAVAFEADAGSESAVVAMVSRALDAFGGLDAVHANAGIGGHRMPPLEQSVELWEEVLRVNLIGPYLAIKHAVPHMTRQGKGTILCTSSAAGFRAGAGGCAYSASKAGLINLVQTTANALRGTGIRVNAVCPGPLETAMTKAHFEQARDLRYADKLEQLNPMGRFGTLEEVAAVAAFLMSDDASFINGQAILVDGGWSSSLPFLAQRPAERTDAAKPGEKS